MNTDLLPETSYVFVAGAEPGKRIGIVKRGESGYYVTDFDSKTASAEIAREAVENFNERLEVTPAQALAMEIGSSFGWDAPGADPRRHAPIEKFVVGETYSCRSIGDWNCIYSFAIVRRSEKTVTISYHGKEVRRTIRVADGSEQIDPHGRYSMSPVLRAKREGR